MMTRFCQRTRSLYAGSCKTTTIRGDYGKHHKRLYDVLRSTVCISAILSSNSMTNVKKWLLVWDFDWTLVNGNSDPWVVEKIGANNIFEEMMKKVQQIGFTKVMDETFRKAHSLIRYSKADIDRACASMEIAPSLIQVLKKIREEKNLQCVIISDSNTIFIENILAHYECNDCFDAIFTNKGRFDANGALRVDPYAFRSHGCHHCPINLCKGQVLSSLMEQQFYDQVVYVGDGSGDFCPCTRLRSNDVIFAREFYPDRETIASLLRKLQESGSFDICRDLNCDFGFSKKPKAFVWRDQDALASMLHHFFDVSQ